MSAVLVTGGAGFLGAAVVRRLAARGERVVALDNFQLSVGPGADWYNEQLEAPPKGALDVSRARAVLGYVPKYDLRRGVAAYVDWYRRGQPITGV